MIPAPTRPDPTSPPPPRPGDPRPNQLLLLVSIVLAIWFVTHLFLILVGVVPTSGLTALLGILALITFVLSLALGEESISNRPRGGKTTRDG